ncbi:MAG TPA: uroporphyrinogen-III synthase [Acidimicrobiia bacterium]|nr:uroporphyrinogen-III synthase [Acidimicrobiia bacterium]
MLHGFTVGITADRRWDEQAALFERRGAAVVHGPSIRTLPLGSDAALRAVTEALVDHPPRAFVANTGLGVRSWFGAADSWGLGAELHHALAGARIYARGPKASGAVHAAGLEVTARAPTERLGEAVELVLRDLVPGDRVAVQVDGSGGSPELARLRAAGAEVVEIPVYEWKLPEDRRPAVRLVKGLAEGRIHAVTFTTGPAVRNLLAIAAEHDLEEALRAALADGRVVVGCVGPVCAEAAVASGLDPAGLVVPTAWRLGPLVRAVAGRLAERTVRVRLEGTEAVLAGTVATVGGEPVELSETEARLFATLAERPNAVFTKTHLLRSVWGDDRADPHLVEVAVARLRRRLGVHGRAVASVHRRGYTLRCRPAPGDPGPAAGTAESEG